ncbi:MAG: DNA-binding protein YbiB [Burkholderiales bacterium]|nr:DNA-binding protein YbiB [Burkholderiales bacterium]MDE2432664.1 DNA-binding protein YbiB [Burkholderiales bacterium]
MSIASYIKVIGRGQDGARPLSDEQAHDLLTQVFNGQVSDLEIGAFCLAMRIKGESTEELTGFVRAAHEHCVPLASVGSEIGLPLVVLPSYNGARKLPNLTPLLAWALSQQGLRVLVHGPEADRTRVTSYDVFQALNWPVVSSATTLLDAWRSGHPAFMAIATLCPPLAKLLDVRWIVGLRNSGHTVAKLLNPFEGAAVPSIRVVNHTHPEYAHSLTAYLEHSQARALLMRGTEGEPVADARRQPRFDVFLHGSKRPDLGRTPQEGVLTQLPELPTSFDAVATAQYIQDVVDGKRPLPEAIRVQVECLVQALAA